MSTSFAHRILIEALRENIAHQVDCELCRRPLGDDRREFMHGPFPIGVHAHCRDLLMSYKLDHSRKSGG